MEEKENIISQHKKGKNFVKFKKNCHEKNLFLNDVTTIYLNEEKSDYRQPIDKSFSLSKGKKIDVPKEMIIKTLNLMNTLTEIYLVNMKRVFLKIKERAETLQKSFMLLMPIFRRICCLKSHYEKKLIRSAFSNLKSQYFIDICRINKSLERRYFSICKVLLIIQSKQKNLEKNALNQIKMSKISNILNDFHKVSSLNLCRVLQ